MFIGHFGIAFFLKNKFKEVPLWLLFIAVQFSDFLAFILIIFGLEKISYNPSANPFFKFFLDYTPYSHSLFANFVVASILLFIFWKIKNRDWGVAVSIGILSHWFLDVLFHRADLIVFMGNYRIGFGLWRFPILSICAEILLLIVGIYFLCKNNRGRRYFFVLAGIMIMFLIFILYGLGEITFLISDQSKLFLMLLAYSFFVYSAYWLEKIKLNNSIMNIYDKQI